MLNVECEKDIYNLLNRIDIERGKDYYKGYIEYMGCDEKNDIATHSFLVESERTYDHYDVEVIVKDNHIVDQIFTSHLSNYERGKRISNI